MTILLATDFSKPALKAYRYAAALALGRKARLLVLNVLPTAMPLDPEYPVHALYLKQLHEESKAELEQFTRRAQQDGLRFETHQVPGDPSECIIDMADAEKAVLIVMGTHGRTGLDRVLLGSVAEKVVRQARCPVMTVRGTEADSQPVSGGLLPVGCFLVPIDFSDCAQEAFEFAVSLAKPVGAVMRLIHAFDQPAYPLDFSLFKVTDEKALHARVRERLQELVTVLRDQGVSAEVVCHVGLPADIILAQARIIPGAMIVMGTHGRRGWQHLAMGSVAEHVVRHAACPVLTVKSPKYTAALAAKSPTEASHAKES
jgi:nucleotide-binding universal stress UspA family protein